MTKNNTFVYVLIGLYVGLLQQYSTTTTTAFSVQPPLSSKLLLTTTISSSRSRNQPLVLYSVPNDNDTTTTSTPSSWWYPSPIPKTIVSALVATSLLWVGLPEITIQNQQSQLPLSLPIVHAKEMASGSGSRVNKDPESLLRLGLPINNKEVRKLQTTVEDIKLDIGTKRKAAALDGVKRAKTILAGKDAEKIKNSCRDTKLCATYLEQISTGLDPLAIALKDSQEAFNGSEQERSALDRAYVAQKNVVDIITLLEEQMIPANYRVPVPDIYKELPQLQGRATVEMIVVKPNKGETYDAYGTQFKEAKLVMIIDGYSSPITAGNFVDLVQKGFYNKMDIQRSDGFVVQTGDPTGDAYGYIGTGSKSVGNGPNGERLIPLEIFIKGDKAPIYETSIEEEGRGGEATVLPFSSYGAMGWARDEYDPNSGSSQFFWLLFDSDLTPAGKNVLDGRYPCFGYVVDGAEFLKEIKEGDIIVSAKVTKGTENLIQPK